MLFQSPAVQGEEVSPECLKLLAALDEVERPEFKKIMEEAVGKLQAEELKQREARKLAERTGKDQVRKLPDPIPEDQGDIPGAERPHQGTEAPDRAPPIRVPESVRDPCLMNLAIHFTLLYYT